MRRAEMFCLCPRSHSEGLTAAQSSVRATRKPTPCVRASFRAALRAAEARDVPSIVGLIRELADFEKLTHLVEVTPQSLHPQLFGERPAAESVVAEREGEVIGFALFTTGVIIRNHRAG